MRRARRIVALMVGLAVVAVDGSSSAAAGDPAAAERQYRIARRLAAERSGEAAAALEKVVALDPTGDLADDALVEQALLLGAAAWPDQLERVSAEASQRVSALLDRVLDQHATSDRALEARYIKALSRLEPLAGYDTAAARLALLELSGGAPGSAWDRRARYTRAWLDARQGNTERALASYQRLLVEAPDSPEAGRAGLGQARILLRGGDHGRAARLLQESIDAGTADPDAPALRELAVRSLLRGTGRLPAAVAFDSVLPATDVRSLVGMAAYPDGGLLLAGRRVGVLRFGPSGELGDRWELDQLQAVAVDARGRAYAAAGDSVYRLLPGEPPRRVEALGDFSPISSMTVDAEGTFWILDRRGDRLARVGRGAEPVQVWRVKGQRLEAIAWDGAQVVALDAVAQTVLAIDPSGQSRPLVTTVGERPTGIAADPTGRLAILDERAGTVNLISRDGSRADRVSLKDAGIIRPAAVVFGLDGRLHVFDGANGAWLRTP